MADHSKDHSPRWDGEIPVRALVISGVGLLLLFAFSALAMYYLQIGVQGRLADRDPPARPVARIAEDARVGPRLQMKPELDQVAMEQSNRARLESWGWVDQRQGLVRMPVADALAWVAERGVDAASAAVATVAVPAAADGTLAPEPPQPEPAVSPDGAVSP